MGKQEQELKAIRSNFSSLGGVLQRGVRTHLGHLRKTLLNLKTMV